MLDKEKLDEITKILKEGIFRNDKFIPAYNEDYEFTYNNVVYYLDDVIASLHNYLYECVTGKPYDYMWHWSNKIGNWCDDDIFKVYKKEDTSNE